MLHQYIRKFYFFFRVFIRSKQKQCKHFFVNIFYTIQCIPILLLHDLSLAFSFCFLSFSQSNFFCVCVCVSIPVDEFYIVVSVRSCKRVHMCVRVCMCRKTVNELTKKKYLFYYSDDWID